jgi:hypothetical protein
MSGLDQITGCELSMSSRFDLELAPVTVVVEVCAVAVKRWCGLEKSRGETLLGQ